MTSRAGRDLGVIARRRLYNQHLIGKPLATPEAIVSWLGAVQSQDYHGAAWAVSLRMAKGSAAAVDRAIDEGRILRTHVLRPTWHFATPADLRWMMPISAPRIHAANRSWNRFNRVTPKVAQRACDIIARAVETAHRTREALREELARGGITVSGTRLACLLMYAEQEQLICSGARQDGKQTYAAFGERVPASKAVPRDEAIGRLAARYFAGHGPATARDFAWWSGLTIGDARAAVALAGDALERETIGGVAYWSADRAGSARLPKPFVRLLPNYDEYVVAYKQRDAVIDPAVVKNARDRARLVLSHAVIVDGRAVGFWQRTGAASGAIKVVFHARLSAAEREAFDKAVDSLGRWLGRELEATGR